MSKNRTSKASKLYSLLISNASFEFEWTLVSLNHDGTVTIARDDRTVVVHSIENNGPQHFVAVEGEKQFVSYAIKGLADLLNGLGYVRTMNQSTLSL